MAHEQLIQQLVQLQKQSDMRLPDSIITGLTKSLTQARYQLIRSKVNPSGAGFITGPTNGTASLLSNVQARRLLWTAKENDGFLKMLNKELQGGEGYPILSAVVGEGVGLIPVLGTPLVSSFRRYLPVSICRRQAIQLSLVRAIRCGKLRRLEGLEQRSFMLNPIGLSVREKRGQVLQSDMGSSPLPA